MQSMNRIIMFESEVQIVMFSSLSFIMHQKYFKILPFMFLLPPIIERNFLLVQQIEWLKIGSAQEFIQC